MIYFNKKLGSKIRQIRQEKKLSQTAFATELGRCSVRAEHLNKSTISRWEKGELLPNICTFFKFCHIYQIDANWLLDIDLNFQTAYPLPDEYLPDDDELLKRIGKKIRTARTSQKITLKELASHLDFRSLYSEKKTVASTVSNWESGLCKMQLSDLREICKRLELDVNHLLDA